MGIKVDIGCGGKSRPGFEGIDIEAYGQKHVRDLKRGLPFSDNTVSEINMSHVLEHIKGGDEVSFFLSELYRVCHNNAIIDIRVPHSSSPRAVNPVHLSYWNEQTMVDFCKNDRASLAISSKYFWNFNIEKLENNNDELYTRFRVIKHDVIPSVEAGKTSIIVVHYQDIDDTKRCLESIKRWTKGVAYQIIVINNETGNKAVKEYLDGLDEITVHHPKENLGWIRGINKGYKLIDDDSDFVIFANNDTVITEGGWLQRLLNHFKEDVGAVGPTSNYVVGRQATIYNHGGIWEESTNVLIGFFMCIRRSVIEQIGLLDERFGVGGADDFDYSTRIKEAGYELKIARDVYIHHSGSKSFLPLLGQEGYDKFWKEKNVEFENKWGKGKVDSLFKQDLHIVCCVPMRTDYLHRLFALRFSSMAKPFRWSVVDAPRGLVHDSRNMLVEKALELNADYIMFIDDDMIPTPDLFVRLYNHNAPVVSALAFKRLPPYDPCIFGWGFDNVTGTHAATPLFGLVKSGIKQVDATGFGAVLIKADVFRKIPKPWFELDKFGEDLDFCLKCQDNDIPIYCDTDLVIQHIGSNEIVDEDTFYKAQKDGVSGSVVVESHEPDKVRKRIV